jgi:hypothetical protein
MKFLITGAAMIILGFASIFDLGYPVFVAGTFVAIAGILIMVAAAAQEMASRRIALAKKKKPAGIDRQLIIYGIGELSMLVALVGFLDIHLNFITPGSDSLHWLLILPVAITIGIIFLIVSYRAGRRAK